MPMRIGIALCLGLVTQVVAFAQEPPMPPDVV
jgi:hypothetical protein